MGEGTWEGSPSDSGGFFDSSFFNFLESKTGGYTIGLAGDALRSIFTPGPSEERRGTYRKTSQLINQDIDALSRGEMIPKQAYDWINKFYSGIEQAGMEQYGKAVDVGVSNVQGRPGLMRSSNTQNLMMQATKGAEGGLLQMIIAIMQGRLGAPGMYQSAVQGAVNSANAFLGTPDI